MPSVKPKQNEIGLVGKESVGKVGGDGKTLVDGEVVGEKEKVEHKREEDRGTLHDEDGLANLKPDIELDLEVNALSCVLERDSWLI